jgi:hypothetical protein
MTLVLIPWTTVFVLIAAYVVLSRDFITRLDRWLALLTTKSCYSLCFGLATADEKHNQCYECEAA